MLKNSKHPFKIALARQRGIVVIASASVIRWFMEKIVQNVAQANFVKSNT
jgi:hypothetical protein